MWSNVCSSREGIDASIMLIILALAMCVSVTTTNIGEPKSQVLSPVSKVQMFELRLSLITWATTTTTTKPQPQSNF